MACSKIFRCSAHRAERGETKQGDRLALQNVARGWGSNHGEVVARDGHLVLTNCAPPHAGCSVGPHLPTSSTLLSLFSWLCSRPLDFQLPSKFRQKTKNATRIDGRDWYRSMSFIWIASKHDCCTQTSLDFGGLK